MPGRARRRPPVVDRRRLPVYRAGENESSFVIAGMDERVEQDTAWAPHAHPAHELLWNLAGASNVTIGSRTWTITPTIGLWVPAGLLHSGRAPAGTWYRTAHFDVRATAPIAASPVAIEITPLLTELLERLADPALAPASRDLTERLVLDVLAPSPHTLLVHRPESTLLQPIVAALDTDPGDPRSLTDWATELGVSERTITRAFSAETTMSFKAWQTEFRMQFAAALLTEGAPVAVVAERVGYASASAFGAVFRRTIGLTPGRVRGDGPPGDVRNATGSVGIA